MAQLNTLVCFDLGLVRAIGSFCADCLFFRSAGFSALAVALPVFFGSGSSTIPLVQLFVLAR